MVDIMICIGRNFHSYRIALAAVMQFDAHRIDRLHERDKHNLHLGIACYSESGGRNKRSSCISTPRARHQSIKNLNAGYH